PAERSAQSRSPWPGSTLGQVRLHRGNGLGGPRCRSREHAEDAGPGGRRPGIPGRRVPSLRGFLPDHATPRAAGPTGGSEPDPASPFWTRSTLRPDLPPASPPRLAIPPRPVAPTNRWLVNRPPPLPTQSDPPVDGPFPAGVSPCWGDGRCDLHGASASSCWPPGSRRSWAWPAPCSPRTWGSGPSGCWPPRPAAGWRSEERRVGEEGGARGAAGAEVREP